MKKKLIVVLGPTASGKSELAIKLAKKFNGEIISADSRQVYKGMDIGTGKVLRDKSKIKNEQVPREREQKSKIQIKNKKDYLHQGIKHHLLDVISPKRRFTVVQYGKLALKAIDKIFKNNKLPILCGGTGFYIQAVVDGITMPRVSPDWRLRKRLEKRSAEKLYQMVKKLDPGRAKNIERKNKRRLIRAIEILVKTKKTIPKLKKAPLPYPVLMIGIKKSDDDLKKLIKKRLSKRLKKGMIAEVKKLKKSGVSWKRLEGFGLEYRWIAKYLQKKISYNEMVIKLQKDIEHFAKRQITWFKRHPAPEQVRCGASKRIHWLFPSKAVKLAKKFLE